MLEDLLKLRIFKDKFGQSLIEAIFGIAIFISIVGVIILMVLNAYKSVLFVGDRDLALSYAKQGVEAVQSIRDEIHTNLANGNFGLTDVSNKWAFLGVSDLIDNKFTRVVTIEDVLRNASDVFVLSGGTVDYRSKKITVRITWTDEDGFAQEVFLEAPIFADYRTIDWREVSDTDFSDSSFTNTEISGTGDSAVVQLTADGSFPVELYEWVEGGGPSFVDTTDTDFNLGTFNNTKISGDNIAASVVLGNLRNWDLFDFPFGTNDSLDVSANWAVGRGSKIFQWTGSLWVEADTPDPGEPPVQNDLNGVFEVSASEAYVVGDGGKFWRYNGSAWVELLSPTGDDMNDLYMFSSGDGFSIGDNGGIFRWNGNDWLTQTSPTSRNLNAIDMISVSDGFAIGDVGTIIRWNGTSWSTISSPTTKKLIGINMISASDGFIVGNNGDILRWNGTSWNLISSPVTNHLNDVKMLSSVDGFIVGDGGTILRWNGTVWSIISSPTGKKLYSAYLINASDGWSVGETGTVLRWNGTSWTTYKQQDVSKDFNGVDLLNLSDGFAVGTNGDVLHWDGSTWTEITSPTSSELNDIHLFASNDGWAVGKSGTIIRWDGASWTNFASPTGVTLDEVEMVASNDGFIVGDGGIILRWNGTTWSSISSPSSGHLRGISMISATDGFIAGDNGEILRWNGTTWSSISSPVGTHLNDVYMLSQFDGFAVGDGGVIIRWDGSNWITMSSPTANKLRAVSLFTILDGYAVGDSGTIIYWNGNAWSNVTSPVTNSLKDIDHITLTEAWAVANNGTLINLGNFFQSSGTFESRIFDSGNVSTVWNTLQWEENNFAPTELTIATRTGNTPAPDVSWSAWSAELTNPILSGITSPAGRYFQYRVTLTTTEPIVSPALKEIVINYNDPGVTTHLNSVQLLSATDGHSVGDSGVILKYNGNFWTALSSPTSNHLNEVYLDTSSHGFAVGDSGDIIRWNGSVWSTVTSPISDNLNGVFTISSTDAWAVGDLGKILQWDGVNWTSVSSPVSTKLNAIHLVSTNDGWAVGDGGVILRWNGVSWASVSSPVGDNLHSIHLFDTNTGWIVGDSGKFLQYNGSTWSEFTDTIATPLHDIYMVSATEAWAVADNGEVFHLLNGAWLIFSSPTTEKLESVWMISDTDGWIVGENGLLMHYKPIAPEIAEFIDDTLSEFNAGTHSDTQYDSGNQWLELTASGLSAGTGTFTSSIKDAGETTGWAGFSWVPQQPYGKPFPTNGAIELGYNSGNADMTGNILLMDMNESSGIINDTSGNSNNGTQSGGVTYGVSGKLKTGIQFDGVDDKITVNDAGILDVTNAITIEAWMNILGDGGSTGTTFGVITDSVIDTFEFDLSDGMTPTIVHVTGNIYAVAYQGPGSDGFVSTFTIDSSGVIGTAVIDTLEFETTFADTPHIILVTGSIFAVVYEGGQSDGFVKTFSIDGSGNIGTVVDTLEFNTSNGETPHIILVTGSIFAVVYDGVQVDGFVTTFSIDGSGNIGTVIDTLEFDTSNGENPHIINVFGTIFAVVYDGASADGFVKTFSIDGSGNIGTVIDTLEFDTSNGETPWIVPVSGDIFAIVYRGNGDDGFVVTVDIDNTGVISNSVIDSFEFDTSFTNDPKILSISGDIFAVAYEGVDSDGFVKTIEINTSGTITNSILDTLEYDTSDGFYPSFLPVSGNFYAIAYQGVDSDGFVKTVEIKESVTNSRGIYKSSAYRLDATTTTASAGVNGQILTGTVSTGWHHIVLTYNRAAASNQQKLYINGIEVNSSTLTQAIQTNSDPLIIGDLFDGVIDELIIYMKDLSATEVLEHYKRGVLNLAFQVRSCNDAACSGESFIGPDGTVSDYFMEEDNTLIGLPIYVLTNIIDNQYFQYQVNLTTDDTTYSPEIKSVKIDYEKDPTPGGGGGGTFSLTGSFLSNVLNSGSAVSIWNNLYWEEVLAPNTDLTIAVRTGNTAVPDLSWSTFSLEFTDPTGNDISAQTGQYIQYRVSMTSDGTDTPKLKNITITFR